MTAGAVVSSLQALEHRYPKIEGVSPMVSAAGGGGLVFTVRVSPTNFVSRIFPVRDWPDEPGEWEEAVVGLFCTNEEQVGD